MSRYLGILFIPLGLASTLVSGTLSSIATFLTLKAFDGLMSIPWTVARLGKFVLLPLLRLPFRFLKFRPKKQPQPEQPERPERSDLPSGSPRAPTALPPARGPCMSPPAREPSPLLRYRSPRSLSETSPQLPLRSPQVQSPRLQVQSPRPPLPSPPPPLRSPPKIGRDSSVSSGSSSPYPSYRPLPSSSPSSRPSSTPS